MIHAFKLYTGNDNNSHVLEGYLEEKCLALVESICFQETPAGSSLEWHTAPHIQYVITLSGVLEFTTKDDERFIINPGDILIAMDNIGTGHKWRLVNDQPWRRAYVIIKKETENLFIPKR